MSSGYLNFCDALWRSWLRGTLDVPADVRAVFDLDAAPEPFLPFAPGPRPLVVLTTNPGDTMPHQRREAVLSGTSPIPGVPDYYEAARALSALYLEQLRGPARRRIGALTRLAELAGYSGVLQVECCPFHSPRLPKTALLKMIAAGGLLGAYVDQLRAFLRTQPVVIISAIGSAHPLTKGRVRLSAWLRWQAELVGLATGSAEFVRLVTKGKATTAAALVNYRDAAPRALALMMGANQLPADAGLRKLAAALSDPPAAAA